MTASIAVAARRRRFGPPRLRRCDDRVPPSILSARVFHVPIGACIAIRPDHLAFFRYIEPGILLLAKSLKTAPNQTNMLLDFLCFMVNDYHPKILRDGDAPAGGNFVQKGIQDAFVAAKSLKVISSLHNLLTNRFMTKELAGTVQATFSALLPGSAPGRPGLAVDGKAGSKKALPASASASASAVPQAEAEYKALIAKLGEPYDHNARSATVEAILLKFCAEEEPPNVALYQRITRALERTLRTSLEGAIPGRIVRVPHAVLFDHVSSTAGWNLQGAQGPAAVAQSGSVGTSADQRLVVILRGLMEPLPKLGFYFLSHIQTLGRDFVKALGPELRHRPAREQAIAHTAGLVTAYAALAASFSGTIDCADEELLTQCVFRDLEMCLVQIGNTDAFYALVPFVYDLFPQSTVGITRLLHLVVRSFFSSFFLVNAHACAYFRGTRSLPRSLCSCMRVSPQTPDAVKA